MLRFEYMATPVGKKMEDFCPGGSDSTASRGGISRCPHQGC